MLSAVIEAVAMLSAPRQAAVQEEGAEAMTEADRVAQHGTV